VRIDRSRSPTSVNSRCFRIAASAPAPIQLLDAAAVGPGKRVLDVATGPGYVAGRAAERGASVVGLDVAGEMVALAARLHRQVEFCRGDAEQLPFDDASFGAVVGNFVVLHLGHPEDAAAEFTRVVAPGGRVALSMWDMPERARLFGVFVDAVEKVGASPPPDIPTGPPFFRFSDDDQLAGLLRDTGLGEIDVRTVGFAHRLESADVLWEGLLRGTVRTRALILGQTDETRARIRSAFDDLVGDYEREGGLDMPVSVKLASGRKGPAGAS
jgi:SAM-dependent methyltransferase